MFGNHVMDRSPTPSQPHNQHVQARLVHVRQFATLHIYTMCLRQHLVTHFLPGWLFLKVAISVYCVKKAFLLDHIIPVRQVVAYISISNLRA